VVENEKGSHYDCSFKLLNYHIKVNFGRTNHRTYDLSLPGRRQKPQTTEDENSQRFQSSFLQSLLKPNVVVVRKCQIS